MFVIEKRKGERVLRRTDQKCKMCTNNHNFSILRLKQNHSKAERVGNIISSSIAKTINHYVHHFIQIRLRRQCDLKKNVLLFLGLLFYPLILQTEYKAIITAATSSPMPNYQAPRYPPSTSCPPLLTFLSTVPAIPNAMEIL